jgi:hypothetical protein
MLLEGFWLVITVSLRVFIIVKYRGCGASGCRQQWGSLFQLAVSPFNWIDRVMGEVAKKVGQMVNEEAAQCRQWKGSAIQKGMCKLSKV